MPATMFCLHIDQDRRNDSAPFPAAYGNGVLPLLSEMSISSPYLVSIHHDTAVPQKQLHKPLLSLSRSPRRTVRPSASEHSTWAPWSNSVETTAAYLAIPQ